MTILRRGLPVSKSLSEAGFDILLSLVGGPSHGYAMVQEIESRRGGRAMQPGLLYTTLPKLLTAQLVEEAPTPADNTDKRRRYYQLTLAGRMAAQAEADRQWAVAQHNHRVAHGQQGALA